MLITLEKVLFVCFILCYVQIDALLPGIVSCKILPKKKLYIINNSYVYQVCINQNRWNIESREIMKFAQVSNYPTFLGINTADTAFFYYQSDLVTNKPIHSAL